MFSLKIRKNVQDNFVGLSEMKMPNFGQTLVFLRKREQHVVTLFDRENFVKLQEDILAIHDYIKVEVEAAHAGSACQPLLKAASRSSSLGERVNSQLTGCYLEPPSRCFIVRPDKINQFVSLDFYDSLVLQREANIVNVRCLFCYVCLFNL